MNNNYQIGVLPKSHLINKERYLKERDMKESNERRKSKIQKVIVEVPEKEIEEIK